MTIEVRQMVIKSTVGDEHGSPDSQGRAAPQADLERLREEILAECQEFVALKLREMAER